MRIIGLTGGIACGKSTVTRMLRELGAVVIDADQISRAVTAMGQPGWQAVAAAFGPTVLLPDGGLDRKALGEIVFNDPQARKRLEEILHPLIRARMEAAIAEAELRGDKVVFLDVPLLFETEWYKRVDAVWLVYADEAIQRQRLMDRDGIGQTAAQQRMDAQLNMEEKLKMADVIIDNRSTLGETCNQVSALWRQLMNENME